MAALRQGKQKKMKKKEKAKLEKKSVLKNAALSFSLFSFLSFLFHLGEKAAKRKEIEKRTQRRCCRALCWEIEMEVIKKKKRENRAHTKVTVGKDKT